MEGPDVNRNLKQMILTGTYLVILPGICLNLANHMVDGLILITLTGFPSTCAAPQGVPKELPPF